MQVTNIYKIKENSKNVENWLEISPYKWKNTQKMEENVNLETEESFKTPLKTPELFLIDGSIGKNSHGYFGKFIDISWHLCK